MSILIPVTFVGLLICAFVGTGKHGLRQSFVYAATVYTTCLVCATELFSIWSLLQFETLLAFWAGLTALSALCLQFSGDRKETRQTLHGAWGWFRASRFELGSVVVILATILLIAVVAPPNDWESMASRMMRVVMWMQQGSIAHYPTSDLTQLYHPPLSVWYILHFQILSDGDRFANVVHWGALTGCGVLASLIVKELKQPVPVQILAAVIAVTLPMGLVQGSSSQGNLIVAFWLLAFVVFTLQYFKNPSSVGLVCGGLALGFALLSKGTAYVIAPPVAATLWLCGIVRTTGYRRRAKLVCTGVGVVLVALVVNGGHFARNWDTFGHPLIAREWIQHSQMNEEMNVSVLIANLVRNAALHWGCPNETINHWILDTVRRVFGEKIDHVPGSTRGKKLFDVGIPFTLGEARTGNFLHFWFLTASLPGILLFRRQGRFDPWTVGLALSGIVGVLAFCGILQWEQWNSRYHTPLFMLGSPLGAIFVTRLLSNGVWGKTRPSAHSSVRSPYFHRQQARSMVAAIFLVTSIPWVISNNIRPLYPLGIWQTYLLSTPSIFSQSRITSYFNHNPGLGPAYSQVIDFLAMQNPKKIGLYGSHRGYEYPIWALLRERLSVIPQLESVEVRNASEKLSLDDALPSFVFSRIEQSPVPETRILGRSFSKGGVYYPVYESGGAAALRKLWPTRMNGDQERNFKRMDGRRLELLARADSDVYLDRNQNTLVYVQDDCSPPAARLVGWVPVVGRPFGAFLSRWVKVKGMSNRTRWQWERGNETEGWTWIPIPTSRRRSYEYTPTVADVGYALRASVEYTDNEGKQIRATTAPSVPVVLVPPRLLDGPRSGPGRDSFFFLHVFPIDEADLSFIDGNQEDFLGFDFTPDPHFRVLLDERCLAVRFLLPPLDIARIRTGVSTVEGPVWEVDVGFPE